MARPSILYVIPAMGGPAPEYALPRLHRCGDVHALLSAPPTPAHERHLRQWCRSVRVLDADAKMPGDLVTAAREVGARAVVAFSEFAIAAVAEACQELGLHGPGPNITFSRDKVAMRQAWRERGLPVPDFVPVRTLGDLQYADGVLRRPYLLKPSWMAGSQGQVLVGTGTDLGEAWRRATADIADTDRQGLHDFLPAGRGARFIAENLIEASAPSWYEADGFGDYVSVEGLVAAGRYHPLCVTARLPTIPPFVELSFHQPTVMAPELQRRIEEHVRAGVDCLGLEYSATHTEIKLQRDQGLCLIENNARLPGAMIPRLMEEAFGLNLIELHVRSLLGEDLDLPGRMLTESPRPGAVAMLMLLPTDSRGRPWQSRPAFRPELVDWSSLVSPGTEVEVVPGLTRPSGSPIPDFSPSGGTRNYLGTVFVRAADPLTLRDDCYRITDGFEAELRRHP
ncbi:ATP-grasp domain-containing protein [Nonomuraea gerenzanensis]|uniref:Putative ligase/carboxylase protein n=1 Tax=Nonomuraea gerenzanensis TaxID=93944 RepID=A0A1M4E9R6_9ACTN|nr:ATP-grasp domain-containing protein [Nonomuraea gerenzanensis]UBU17877.1 ATP-grasp domain-containing protein [Nonomuraea gerenzanensis]SBO95669.1 Putative ligase/carboxylase protein [Nonomuraea gerenzanensis]